jgi:hypothetical protein
MPTSRQEEEKEYAPVGCKSGWGILRPSFLGDETADNPFDRKFAIFCENIPLLPQMSTVFISFPYYHNIAKQKDAKISMFEAEEEKKRFGNIFYMNVFLMKSACVLSSKEQYNLIVVCYLSPHLHYRLNNILH